ncbi:MAG: hypothetical protein U1F98_15930 [Verrucomicrobiota bacterium]
MKQLALFSFIAAAALPAAAQVVLFADNFERGNLNQWTNKFNDVPHAQIVADPLNPANRVLNFFQVNAGGDIFSARPARVDGTRQHVVLSFDFLGLPNPGTQPADIGGFAAIATDNTGYASWFVAGTYIPALNVPAPIATPLAADGQWHHYDIDVTDLVNAYGMTNIQVALEDWYGLDGIAGDAYFDNIVLTAKLDPSVIEQLVPCSGPAPGKTWRNHTQYVLTMAAAVNKLYRQGLISREEQEYYFWTAFWSRCGGRW